MLKGSCLLCGGQAVFCSAENATDQAELIYGELGRLTAFFFLQQAADGETPTVTAGPGQNHREKTGREDEDYECFSYEED